MCNDCSKFLPLEDASKLSLSHDLKIIVNPLFIL